MQGFQLVWLKRDLRWQDHQALREAIAQKIPLIVIYIWEPEWFEDPHHSKRQAQLIESALAGMTQDLGSLNQHLIAIEGSALKLFELLISLGLQQISAHREHGLAWTDHRDKQLRSLCKKHGIPFKEYNHNGVWRGIQNRDGWDERWRDFMQSSLENPDLGQWPKMEVKDIARLKTKLLESGFRIKNSEAQLDFNRQQSLARLKEFLGKEANAYQANIGKPLESRDSCSRLSTALAWGTLSLREVYQASVEAYSQAEYKSDLQAFIARLHWHSHFIQKFEMEMRMEHENLNRAYNAHRQEFNPEYFEAWKEGKTGFPLVDACMRAVAFTGYLNFRMRAMVVSFWSHILWQAWQPAAAYLASCFDDYIPGIHYPQFQMQSSVTGINTIRIYNPVKQSQEKDPRGIFIRTWLPNLASLPLPFQHEPWKLSPLEQQFYNFEMGKDYPTPIVDFAKASQHARDTLWSFQKDPLVQQENARIIQKHTVANRKLRHRTQTILAAKAHKHEH